MGSGKGKNRRALAPVVTRIKTIPTTSGDQTIPGVSGNKEKFRGEVSEGKIRLAAEEVGEPSQPHLSYTLTLPENKKGQEFSFWFEDPSPGSPEQIHAQGAEVAEYTFDIGDFVRIFKEAVETPAWGGSSGNDVLNDRNSFDPCGPGAGDDRLAVAHDSSKRQVKLHEIDEATGFLRKEAIAEFRSGDVEAMLRILEQRAALAAELLEYREQQLKESGRRSVILNRQAQPQKVSF